MNILVLGGSYFIGLSILDKLRGLGDITVLNRGTKAVDMPGIDWIGCDRKNSEELSRKLVKEYDVIVDISAYEPEDVDLLFHALKKLPSKYILISSSAVYKNAGATLPYAENSIVGGDPVWGDYGVLKYECEQAAERYLPSGAYAIRPPYVYGPHNYLEREQFIWARLLGQHPIFVPGDGSTRIQFCYVDDLARLVARMAADPQAPIPPGIYNIGENAAYSFNDYIGLLAEICGSTPILRHVTDGQTPARDYFPFRHNDVHLDVTRISEIPGLTLTGLQEGMTHTYRWFQTSGQILYTPTAAEQSWL